MLDESLVSHHYLYKLLQLLRKTTATMNALYDVGIAALPRHLAKNGLERTLLAIYRASTLCL